MLHNWKSRLIFLGVLLSSGSAGALDPSQTPWTYSGGVVRVGPNSIAVSGPTVWGIATNSRLYFYSYATHSWVMTNGSADAGTQLSIGGGKLWVSLNSASVLWFTVANACPSSGNCAWTNVNPGFTISTLSAGDGAHPWVINSAGTGLFRYDGSQFQSMVSGTWPGFTSGATLTQVAVGTDDDAWALDSNGNVIHRTSSGWVSANPKIPAPPGPPTTVKVSSLSVMNASTVWAASTTSGGLFNFRPPNVHFPTQSPWERQCPITGGCSPTFTSVSARRSPATGLLDVWGVTTQGSGNIYHVDQSNSYSVSDTSSSMLSHYSLVNVAGTLTQIATSGPGNVWGSSSNGSIFTLPGNWLQFGGDSTHAGNNGIEANIGPPNMSALASLPGFGRMPASNAPPVIAMNVATASGFHDVALVNSHGNLKAVDAYDGGNLIWAASPLLTESPQQHGFEGSPAIDPALQFVYNIGPDEKVHKYQIETGVEVTSCTPANPLHCWPEVLTVDPGEYSKTSLTIGVSGGSKFLYAGTSSSGSGSTRGHVTTISLDTGTQTVFNVVCSDLNTHIPAGLQPNCASIDQGGIWQRAGVTFDPVTNKLYTGTGEGLYDGVRNWTYSVIALNPNGTGNGASPVDAYTPSAVVAVGIGGDLDLSSTNTLVLPNSGNGGRTYQNFTHLAAQSGKDGYVRLINMDNMSGQGPPPGVTKQNNEVASARLPTVGTQACNATGGACPVTGPIATWINPADNKNWIFVNSFSGINAMRVVESNGTILSPVWPTTQSAPTGGRPGGVFVANGVLYYVNGSPGGLGGRPGLHAVDATTGRDSTGAAPADGTGQPNHQTSVVVNGVLYHDGFAFFIAP